MTVAPYLLSCCECQFKVLLALGGVQCVVIKCFGEEGVHQCTESHPIIPARGEILQIYVLGAGGGRVGRQKIRRRRQVL